MPTAAFLFAAAALSILAAVASGFAGSRGGRGVTHRPDGPTVEIDDDGDVVCPESAGLVKVLVRGEDADVWRCANFTPYTDDRGVFVGGNCSGDSGGGVISFDGSLRCHCASRQVDVNGLQVCATDAELHEVD